MTRMEELTQTQIILLTLLVSFITSIATGIITTSLLAEAPAGVTQTINRVVEHTIERVVPPIETSNGNTEGTTVKEVTVIKEDDAVISAIEKASGGIVRIKGPVLSDGSEEFYGIGIVVSSDGIVVSDLRNATTKEPYEIDFSDGTSVTAHAVNVGTENNLGVFKIDADQSQKTFTPVAISPSEPKLGQTVIAIEGKDKNSIALGRVLSVQTNPEKTSKGETVNVAYSITTDIGNAGELAGSPLFDLSGELIGIKTSNNDLSLTPGVYTTVVPINVVVNRIRQ